MEPNLLYLTKAACANRLSISKRTLERYMASGVVPFIRLGPNTPRFDPVAVKAALDALIQPRAAS